MHYNDTKRHIRYIKYANHNRKQHMTQYWADSLNFPVESPSCHNGFPLDLDDHKNKNGVATDLFYMGVIGHPKYMF